MEDGKDTNERLAVIETEVKEIRTSINNHLKHHWEFNMVLLSAISIEALAFLGLALFYIIKHA